MTRTTRLRMRVALWLPREGEEWPGWTLRLLAAVTVTYGPRALIGHFAGQFRKWTLLPGDRVRDWPRNLEGEVRDVPAPGMVGVVWTRRQDRRRFGDRVDEMPVSDEFRVFEAPDWPGGYIVTRKYEVVPTDRLSLR